MSDQRTINTTAGEIQSVLRQRGLLATDPVTVTITVDPTADLLGRARAACRARVVAAGLSDEDIDKLIEDARQEVNAET